MTKRLALVLPVAGALALVAAGAMAAEMPDDVAALVKKRLYADAAKAAEGKVGAEVLADIKALAAAKSWVLKGTAAGKRRPVTIKMMGQRMRATVVKADEESYTVTAMGVAQKKTWAATPDDRFYFIARKYADGAKADDHITLARACIALGLADQVEEELQDAIRLNFALTKAADALRARVTGGGGTASTGTAEADDPGARRPSRTSGTTRKPGRPAQSMSAAGVVTRNIPSRSLPDIEGDTETVTASSGSLSFTVTKHSGGFVDELRWGGQVIAKSGGSGGSAGSRRSFCDAFHPAQTTDRQGNVGELAKSKAVVTAITGGGSTVTVAGVYRSAAGEAKFVNRITASGDTLKVSQSVSIGWSPGQWRLAGLGVSLPFALTGSKHGMITTVPGEKRSEWWKLDYNDDRKPNWMTSDSRSRWPLWRVGGLLVDSQYHYRTWKTNMLNTWPLTMDEGLTCPGYVNLQDSRKGVNVTIANIRKESPKEIMVGMAPGLVTVYFWSPHVAPLSLLGTGTADKSLAERLGIYPGSAKTHTASFTFTQGGKSPKSIR